MPQQGEPGGGGGGSASTLEDQVAAALNGYRLTLASGDPVPTSDLTAKTSLYLTPYLHAAIGLYDGSRWEAVESDEVSIAVPATTATVYDVFAYSNSGVLTLELVAWSTATARATALARQDGVWVKSGDATRRYVGSFRTTGVSGQTEDSEANRLLWNADNQVWRQASVSDSTDHTYASGTLRYFDDDSTNLFGFVLGLATLLSTQARSRGSQAAAGVAGVVRAEVDATTGVVASISSNTDATVEGGDFSYFADHYVAAGYHTMDMKERIEGAGTYNFDLGNVSSIWLG